MVMRFWGIFFLRSSLPEALVDQLSIWLNGSREELETPVFAPEPCCFIEGQEIPVGFTGVAFVGIDFFDLALSMTTVNCAVGQKVAIVVRSRGVRVVASTKPCLASTAACSLSPK
jgi:hypothetical protein